jgi:hypothetical protein
MMNEALAKMLRHNLVVFIHEMYELGVAPIFDGAPSFFGAGTADASVTLDYNVWVGPLVGRKGEYER